MRHLSHLSSERTQELELQASRRAAHADTPNHLAVSAEHRGPDPSGCGIKVTVAHGEALAPNLREFG